MSYPISIPASSSMVAGIKRILLAESQFSLAVRHRLPSMENPEFLGTHQCRLNLFSFTFLSLLFYYLSSYFSRSLSFSLSLIISLIPGRHIKEGYLSKHSSTMFKRGRRLWYILGEDHLAFKKHSQSSRGLIGYIDLRDITSIEPVNPKKSKTQTLIPGEKKHRKDRKDDKDSAVAPASFTTRTESRIIQLQAESAAACEEWVETIRAQCVMSMVRKRKERERERERESE